MTVSSTTTRHSFAGTDSTGPFSISFTIQDASHIQVYWDKGSSGTTGTPTSSGAFVAGASGYLIKDVHYSVQNAGTTSNATITLLSGGWTIDSTLQYATSADTFIITRDVSITQTTDYQNNSAIDAETLENSFDKITQIVQQVNDDSGYSIKFSSALAGTAGFDTDSDTASTISQNKADRINNLVSFDSNGDIIATQELGSWRGDWITGTTYVQRDLVKDSETGAVYICLVGHSSGTFATDLSASKWESIIDAGGFNVKLSADLTINVGETFITPYKLDLNGKILTNNGTLTCAEIITGEGTLTGSGSTTQSGLINISASYYPVTLTATQTLTNKTLTSPKINEDVVMSATATELNLLDNVSGLVQADFTKLAAIDATADELNVMDAGATITTPTVAGGDAFVMDDADVGMRQVDIDNVDTYLSQTTVALTNKTLTTPKIADAGYISDANGAEQLVFQTTSSAENHFEMTNAADSNSPQLAALGDDTNVGMILNTKGTGSYELKVGGTLALTIALSGGNTTITGP